MKLNVKTPRAPLFAVAAIVALLMAMPQVFAEENMEIGAVPAAEIQMSDTMQEGSHVESATGPSVPPPPTGLPIAPLSRIEIIGATSLQEGGSEQYLCKATRVDDSTDLVDAVWSENSPDASISTSGVLSVGDVAEDALVQVVASFEGKTATNTVTISAVQLTGLTISGPAEVNEKTAAQYTCVAAYSDGSSSVVAPSWSENSSAATISSSGILSAGDVVANQTVTLTAELGGLTKTYAVTVKYVAPILTGIIIVGPDALEENASASYICMASDSDGGVEVITPSWSVSGPAAVDHLGRLSAGDVATDQTVILTASYQGKIYNHSVSVRYVAPVMTSLTISGPAVLDECCEAQFACTASFDDGSSDTVQVAWSVDSAIATVDAGGLVAATNILVDTPVMLTATYEGEDAVFEVLVRVAETQIIYPLGDFSGKTVQADIFVEQTGEFIPLGEFESPEELILEGLGADQWYWLTIKEWNTAAGDWIPVQENWIHM